MMFSRAALISAFLVGSIASAQTQNEFSVKLNDGAVGHYKLLPVHHVPAHAKVVKQRLARLHAKRDLPKSYDIPKNLLPPVRDQGQRGTCAYFATVGLVEAWLNSQSEANKAVKVSEQCLVQVRNWMADTESYTGDDKPVGYRPDPDGDWPQLITKTVTSYGIPAEGQYSTADCRYETGGTDGISLDNYQAAMTDGGSPAYAKGHAFDVSDKPTVDQIKEMLNKNTPVEVGILVYTSYFDTPDWAYDADRDQDWALAGGHAVQLVGYTTAADGRTVFTFKNSWGDAWGNSGYGTIDDKLLEHSWAYDPGFDFSASLHD